MAELKGKTRKKLPKKDFAEPDSRHMAKTFAKPGQGDRGDHHAK